MLYRKKCSKIMLPFQILTWKLSFGKALSLSLIVYIYFSNYMHSRTRGSHLFFFFLNCPSAHSCSWNALLLFKFELKFSVKFSLEKCIFPWERLVVRCKLTICGSTGCNYASRNQLVKTIKMEIFRMLNKSCKQTM